MKCLWGMIWEAIKSTNINQIDKINNFNKNDEKTLKPNQKL
ncbi:hypothetical protein [Helicobacter sp. T3_23-1059]